MLSKAFSVAAVIAAFGAMGGTAQAMTISLGAPTLSDRVSVTEPVTVACSPFDPSLTLFSEGISVSLEQASGRSIARGSGFVSGFLPTLPFACDGTPTTIPVTVLADTSGPPFHGGQAVFSVSAGASAGTPCFPGTTSCFTSPIVNQSVSSGPTSLNLH
jgi:hypothetical protein